MATPCKTSCNAIVSCCTAYNAPTCAICPIGDVSADWQKHIKNPLHKVTRERFDLVFVRRGTATVYCKICNAHLFWEDVKSHAFWHKLVPWYVPKDLFKKFFVNKFLEWQGRFYCYPCDRIFPVWSAAFLHIGDEKHHRAVGQWPRADREPFFLVGDESAYKTLVSGGISWSNLRILMCRMCNRGRSVFDVLRHIGTTRHAQSQSKFIDALRERMVREFPEIEDLEPLSRASEENAQRTSKGNAQQTSVEKKTKEATTEQEQTDGSTESIVAVAGSSSSTIACEDIVKLPDGKLHCEVSDGFIPENSNVAEHLVGLELVMAMTKYGCESISLTECECHCERGDCTVCKHTNNDELRRHAEGETHRKSPNVSNQKEADTIAKSSSQVTPIEREVIFAPALSELSRTGGFVSNGHSRSMNKPDEGDVRTAPSQSKNIAGESTNADQPQLETAVASISSDATKLSSAAEVERIETTTKLQHETQNGEHQVETTTSNPGNVALESRATPKENKEIFAFALPEWSSRYIVESGKNEFFCNICDLRFRDYETFDNHVKSEIHAMAVKKYDCDSIIWIDKYYYCRRCECKIQDRDDVPLHVKGNGHSKIMNQLAEEHVRTAPSQSDEISGESTNADLPKSETPVASVSSNLTKLSSGAEVERNETTKKPHLQRASQTEKPDVPTTTSIGCNVPLESKLTPKKNEVIIAPALPKWSWRYITEFGKKQFFCNICDLGLRDYATLDTHVKGEMHVMAVEKYDCESIIFRDKYYYCGRCECNVHGRKNVSLHVKGKRHIKRINTSIEGDVRTATSRSEKIAGESTSADLPKSETSVCSVSSDLSKSSSGADIGGTETSKKPHLQHESEKKNTNVQTTTSKVRNVALESTVTPKEHEVISAPPVPESSWHCISKMVKRTFCCKICDLKFRNCDALDNHVKGETHAMAVEKYYCDSIIYIYNHHYCLRCKCEIQGRNNILPHVKGNRHLYRMNKVAEGDVRIASSPGEKIVEQNETTTESLMQHESQNGEPEVQTTTTDVRNVALESAVIPNENEDIFMFDIPDITWQYFVEFGKSKLLCKICNLKFPDYDTFLGHFDEEMHAMTVEKYHCDSITFRDKYYYCERCECQIHGRDSIVSHVKGNRHSKGMNKPAEADVRTTPSQSEKIAGESTNVDQSQLETPAASVPSKPAKPSSGAKVARKETAKKPHWQREPENEKSKVQTTTSNVCNVALESTLDPKKHEVVPAAAISKPSWYYIVELGKKEFLCKICDLKFRDHETFDTHVNGEIHAMAVKNYDCDSIIFRDDSYYCSRCECEIRGRNEVPLHVKSNRHFESMNKVAEGDVRTAPSGDEEIAEESTNTGQPELETSVDSVSSKASKSGAQKPRGKRESVNEKSKVQTTTINARNVALVSIMTSKNEEVTSVPALSASSWLYVVEIDNKKFRCKICDLRFRDYEIFDAHIKGEIHATAVKKYDCESIISSGRYCYCNRCECEIQGLDNILYHVKGNRHFESINKVAEEDVPTSPSRDEKIFEESTNTGQPNTETLVESVSSRFSKMLNGAAGTKKGTARKPSGKHESKKKVPKIQTTTSNACNAALGTAVTEKKKEASAPISTGWHYIVESGKNKFCCKICDLKFRDYPTVDDHVKGETHTLAMARYGCDSIMVTDNYYWCSRCVCTIPDWNNVFLHVKSRRHSESTDKSADRDVRTAPSGSGTIAEESTSTGQQKSEALVASVPINVSELFEEKEITKNGTARILRWRDASKNRVPKAETVTGNTCNVARKSKVSRKKKKAIFTAALLESHPDDVVKFGEEKFACPLCDLEFCDDASLYVHYVGEIHATTMRDCAFDSIVARFGFHYCCLCGSKFCEQENVFEHVRSGRHAANVKQHVERNIRKSLSQSATIDGESTSAGQQKLETDASVSSSVAELSNAAEVTENGTAGDSENRMPEAQTATGSVFNVAPESAATTKEQEVISASALSATSWHYYIFKFGEEQFRCRICDLGFRDEASFDIHVNGETHSTALKKYHCDSIILKDESYYCERCECKIHGRSNVFPHVKGKRHSEQRDNDNEEKTRNDQSDDESSRSMSAVETRPGVESVESNTDDNAGKLECFTGDANSPSTSGSSTIDVDTVVEDAERNRSTEETAKVKDDSIRDIEERLSEVELDMRLSLIVDSTSIYCLVCKICVASQLHDYYEHLGGRLHRENFDKMNEDHARSESDPGRFSALSLASQYMEEISDDLVRCLVCAKKMYCTWSVLRDHMDNEAHIRVCREKHATAKRNFKNIMSRIRCEWYDGDRYVSVPCLEEIGLAASSVTHVNSEERASGMRESVDIESEWFPDFCRSCSVMWYGKQMSYANDCKESTRISHKEDGDSSCEDLPTNARNHLATLEKYIEDKIAFLDKVCVIQRPQERKLILDLKRAVKRTLPFAEDPHLQCLTFDTLGSKLSGVASMGSDIDVLVDYWKGYDWERFFKEHSRRIMTHGKECLEKDSQTWERVKVSPEHCQSVFMRVRHVATGFACNIFFGDSPSVKNIKLIKYAKFCQGSTIAQFDFA